MGRVNSLADRLPPDTINRLERFAAEMRYDDAGKLLPTGRRLSVVYLWVTQRKCAWPPHIFE